MSIRRKRICFITGGHWAAVMGGAQYQVKCILDELVKTAQFDISYLARNINQEFKSQGYTIKQISKPNKINRQSFLFDYKKLMLHLKMIKPDVIYQRGMQPYTGYAAYYAKKNNCDFVFHVAHDFDAQPGKVLNTSRIPFLKYTEKKIGVYGLRNATRIIAQTNYQRDLVKQNYNIDVDVVVPNFHPKPVEDLVKNDNTIDVVWVANFKPVKQPEIFVELAEQLKSHKHIRFIMIGRPGADKLYSKLHVKMKTMPNLMYMNEQPIDKVNEVLSKAHIFVNTSEAEGFANTFIQAWMRKVPVLSLNINTDGIFDSKKLGIYSGNIKDLSKNLIELTENTKLRNDMGEYAQDYAYQNHSTNNVNKITSLLS